MEITRDNLLSFIRTGLKAKDLSISSLEREAGVPKDTVRDFLRAKTQILRADKLQKILRILEPQNKIVISGYVTEGAQIVPATDDKKQEVDCPPGVELSDVVAVRVEGDAALPIFHDGWIIYYSANHDASIPALRGGLQVPYNKPAKKAVSADRLAEFVGKPCIIKLKDERLMLAVLKKGSQAGRYTLARYSGNDIKDAEIEWASKIIFIKTN